jgi:hypothetical protein
MVLWLTAYLDIQCKLFMYMQYCISILLTFHFLILYQPTQTSGKSVKQGHNAAYT